MIYNPITLMKSRVLMFWPFLLAGIASTQQTPDPALSAFSSLTNDTFVAGSICSDLGENKLPHDDEKLRFLANEETVYGEAEACTPGGQCRFVLIRPPGQIAKHWLTVLQLDWLNFVTLAPKSEESLHFVADLKRRMQQPEAVWAKLVKAYCDTTPHGKYKDLDGMDASCKIAT